MSKYDAYGCPIRYGLSVFGDRWSLLVIRDLMFKGRRYYSEFLTAGEGISTNILADRLHRLEASGVVEKNSDPAHGKKFVYSLTEKGRDLVPVMLAIMDWAEKYDELTEVPPAFAKALHRDRDKLAEEILAGLDQG